MMPNVRKLIAGLVVLGLISAVGQPARAEDEIAVIKLKGAVAEAPPELDLSDLLGSEAPPNMFDLLRTLRKARTDNNLRAIIFDVDEAQLGFAQIQELRSQFEALRAADKDVLIFTEGTSTGGVLLGSAATRLVLLPSGEVMLPGLFGEMSYYKNLLDKIGVEAQILHCGSYKSAGEPFYRTGPSKEAEEMTNWLLDGIFEQVVDNLGKSRKITPEQVKTLIDKAIFSPKEALEAKLVDKLQYREDFIASLKKQYGEDVKIVHNYGKKQAPKLNLDNPFAIFQVFSELMKPPAKSTKPAIAVVFVDGMITTGPTEPSFFGGSSNAGSTTIRKAIADAAKDENVKALLLRVDSPGGSAVASDIICEAVKRFRQSGRPVIVSMGNVAGSGGYYVSCLGDKIFAEPSTITGSIGVVGGKFVTKGLWDWVGITSHEFKRGKHADLFNTNRKWNESEQTLMQGTMDRIYGEFKARVVEGRGKKIKGDLEPLAGGRVYTGKQALDIGLVDQLGGFADAIKQTAELAELPSDCELRVYPRPKSLFDMLGEAFGGKSDDEEGLSKMSVARTLGGRLIGHPEIAKALESVQALDPQKAKSLRNFLTQVELLSNEGVLLVGPSVSTSLR